MIVLIDMDEVITDFEGRLRTLWNEKYPHTPLFRNDVRDQFYIGKKDEYANSQQVLKIINTEGFFSSLDEISGVKSAIKNIQSLGHKVFIVTSPGVSFAHAAAEKYQWILKHFGREMLSNLIITPAKPMIRGDILIDDNPHILNEDIATWEHVLYDKSYNKQIKDLRRLTWQNWDEVLTELL